MAPSAEIRPMTTADVDAAGEVWLAAYADLGARHRPPALGPVHAPTGAERARLCGRIAHLLASDPQGSWVAEREGQVLGLALSFVRGSYWVLSLLGVDPSRQGSGVGRALLERALAHGAGCPGTIQTSVDPRASHLYAEAGFDPHPSMAAFGPVTRRPPVPDGVRAGGAGDLAVATAVDRAVRGAGREVDLRHLLADPEATLWLCAERAYALAKPDRLVTVAGRDGAAAAVLTAALSGAAGDRPFEIGWLTGPQQWAVRPAVAAGLSLVPTGPVMVRGMDGPPAPYLPSGGLG